MAEKQQSIYGGYRNEAFYENFYKDKSAAQAYVETVEYLKKPTFKFEKDCALKVYVKVYGTKFQSSEQHQIESQADEIVRLRAELEKKVEPPITHCPAAEKEIVTENNNAFSTDIPRGMDKEAFKLFYISRFEKAQHVKPHWTVWDRAWKNYQKNEISA